MRHGTRLAVVAGLSGWCIGCDQATKRVAVNALKGAAPSSFLGDTFRLQYAENPGAFLSLGADLEPGMRHWLLVVAVGVVLAGFLAYALMNRRLGLAAVSGLALLAGGGISNWLDRVFSGGVVVDFMNMGIGPVRTGIFNVADIAIMAGAAMVAWPRRRAAPAASDGGAAPDGG